jgi:glycogen(starch) synthase
VSDSDLATVLLPTIDLIPDRESGIIRPAMRILHVTQRYWPARGGAETLLEEIASRLAADGHQVTVASTDALDFELFWDPARRRVTQREEIHRGVRVLRFPVRHLPIPRLSYPAIRRLLWLLSALRPVPVKALYKLARFTPWVPELYDWLASTDEPFDLVTGTTVCFEPLAEAGLRLARRRGVPFAFCPLTHLGAGDEPGKDALSRFYTMRHQASLVRASDAVVALTPSEGTFYEHKGIDKKRILVAGPGIDPADVLGGDRESFRHQHNLSGPVIACLSAMAYDKGTIHLVEAMRRLWQTDVQAELVLAGAVLSPFQRYLEGLPDGDRQRLHVLGSITEAEKRDLLAGCDIFAMPSRTESFGIVYLEAWLNEKPVIGARSWAIRDVIDDGKDGLLIPFGDVQALAQAIQRFIDHPDERRAFGTAGRQKVEKVYTWDRKYGLVKNLYERLPEDREAIR